MTFCYTMKLNTHNTKSTLTTEYEATNPERERLPSLKGGKYEFKRNRKP